MYRVLIEHRAERELKRLDREIAERIAVRLKELAKEPRPRGVEKLKAKPLAWRLRIGDYRVLYEVNDPAQTVKIYRIRHRREAYR